MRAKAENEKRTLHGQQSDCPGLASGKSGDARCCLWNRHRRWREREQMQRQREEHSRLVMIDDGTASAVAADAVGRSAEARQAATWCATLSP